MNFYDYTAYITDYRLRVQEGERIAALYRDLPRDERPTGRKVVPLAATVTVRHGREDADYTHTIAA